jgi:large subunit ribosomal protein L34e
MMKHLGPSRIKTPGGNVRYLYQKKTVATPKCGDTGVALPGLKAIRSSALHGLTKTKKTVSRVYGGCLSGKAVRERFEC